MKRFYTLFLALLIVCSGFGQTIVRDGNTILRAYDANQPLNINTTCEFWFDGWDASSFTLDGTSVDQWDDKSGNDRHVLNTNNDATRPTYDSNTGRVTFTATNSTFLQSAAFGAALEQPNTIFIVYKITGDLSDVEIVFTGLTTLKYHQIFYESSLFQIHSQVQLSSGIATNADDNIHVTEFNGANSKYWINGVLAVTGNAGLIGLGGITLGAYIDVIQYNADVEICEVIGFGSDISATDQDIITAYLADKWNITSTTTHKGYILRY